VIDPSQMLQPAALLASSLLIASCAQEPPSPAPFVLPEEVSEFVSERDTCEHLRGDVPEPGIGGSDAPPIDDINRSCAGTDRRLEMLRAKYASRTSSAERRTMQSLSH